MEQIMYVLTDALHLLKIIILCDLIFMFRKRKRKYVTVVSTAVMLILSLLLHIYNNDMISFVSFLITLCLYICLIYDEKIYELIISSIWIIFLTSMLDLLFTEMVTVLFDMLKLTNQRVGELTASAVSLLFILLVGQIYKSKYKIGIKNIGFVKLFLFTILATADAFVIMSLIIKVATNYCF